MKNTYVNRNSFGKKLVMILLIVFVVISVFAGCSQKEDAQIATEFPVENSEEIAFEGVKLSEVTKLEMLKYIDFTVPYNWTFGKVDVDNPSTEEAIAITSNDTVLMVSLRNIEMESDKESILWAE